MAERPNILVLFVWLWDLMDGVLNRKLFYAYDVSWAYITAEDEAMAKAGRFVKNTQLANKIRDQCGRNKLQTLKNVIDIQQKYPNIEVATKTRQAARKTLNKALDALHDLHDGGLLDDKQFGMLYEDLTWMIHRVDGMPTNIIVGDTAHCILLSIPWLPREEVTKLLKSFFVTQKKGNVLSFVGHEHERVSIICSGIVKVYGKGTRQSTDTEGRLQNADSNQYFFSEGDFKDYLVSPDCIGLIGFLSAMPSVCQAVCETDVELCSIPMEVMERITEQHPDPPTVIYRMWFSVAVRVALGVLINHKRYQDWTHDKLKQFLEGGIMPNLYYAIEFSLDEAVQDVILIQGCVVSAEGHRYFGPCYLPQALRQMKLPGSPNSRPRPVMLITTLMRYHLPPELDWYHQPLRHYDYMPRTRTDEEYAHWGDTPPPVTGLCSTCNCRADLNHLCWECPVYNPPRLRALATIKRGPWPSSLRTWACPEPSPPDRAIEFWRALIMFLQDPAAPPVGDQLRDSHKIQAIQAAPT
ncbi:sperm-specific sodium:proton exchanger-like [Rhipicephalus microplus]|uniref:sperm-specific sodium:proton exchanger-like n=1 Tax=Rhipicephalus microplus TaxID=6941 RepID=UPI003F6D12C1